MLVSLTGRFASHGVAFNCSSYDEPASSMPNKKTTELGWPDIASAFLIFLSVFITLLEACYISHTDLRIFANYAQAAFAACFCTQQGYNLYTFVSEQETSVAESVEAFFTRGKDAFWHVFDAVLNIVSILDIFVDTWEGRFVHGLAAMRVVRAFRLFRIFASNKFLNDFSRVMHTALLQMLNFCLVIVLSLTLASVVATNMLWDFPNEQVADSYADLGTTMWTLFKIMTMDGWTTKIQPCLELHPSLLYFFALFVFFPCHQSQLYQPFLSNFLLKKGTRGNWRNGGKEKREDVQCNALSACEKSQTTTPPIHPAIQAPSLQCLDIGAQWGEAHFSLAMGIQVRTNFGLLSMVCFLNGKKDMRLKHPGALTRTTISTIHCLPSAKNFMSCESGQRSAK